MFFRVHKGTAQEINETSDWLWTKRGFKFTEESLDRLMNCIEKHMVATFMEPSENFPSQLSQLAKFAANNFPKEINEQYTHLYGGNLKVKTDFLEKVFVPFVQKEQNPDEQLMLQQFRTKVLAKDKLVFSIFKLYLDESWIQ